MANVRLTRQAAEVLFKAPPAGSVTRLAAEALVDTATGTGPVQLTRQAAEALMVMPPIASVVRLAAEALVDPATGTGPVQLTRQAGEVLYKLPPNASVTRLTAEALVDTVAGTGAVQLARQAVEVLFPRPSPQPVPEALVSAFELFIHDWSTGMKLVNAYMTDVTGSQLTGAEERRILRDKPLRTQSIHYVNESKATIDRLIVNARRLTAARVQFPLYCDESHGTAQSASGQTSVWCSTNYRRFFIGARVVIVPAGQNFVASSELETGIIAEIHADHLVLVDNLTKTWAAGRFIVYPLLDCEYVLQPNPVFLTHDKVTWSMSVVERLGANTLPATRDGRPPDMPLLENIPVVNFNIDQDFVAGVSVTYTRDGQAFDRGRGTVVDPDDYRYKQTTEWNLVAGNRADAWKVVQFLDWARGRGKAFFVMDEEDLWTPLVAATTFIEVDPFGTFSDFQADFSYVGIEMDDGQIHARRVNTIQNLGSVWRITITGEALPAINLAEVRRISRVRKSRLLSDSHEENWRTLEVCTFRFQTIEVLDEGEVTT